MTERNKRILKFIVKLSITTILLLWVFSQIDISQLGKTIENAQWQFFLASWVLTLAAYWLLSFKMRLIMKRLNCDVGIGTIFITSAISALYGMALPGILDITAKWYILKVHTGKPSHILSGMMYNQFTEMLMVIIFGLSALIIANPTSNFKLPSVCIFLLIIIISCTLLLFNRVTGPKVNNFFGLTLKWLPSKMNIVGQKILDQLSIFQTTDWIFHLQILLLTTFTTFLSIIFYVFAAKAACITVPLGVLVWQSSLVYLLGRLPIAVADLGVREVALVESLAQYGVSAPEALLMSMVIFSNRILIALIGAVFQICWSPRKSESQASPQKPFQTR